MSNTATFLEGAHRAYLRRESKRLTAEEIEARVAAILKWVPKGKLYVQQEIYGLIDAVQKHAAAVVGGQ